MRKPTAPKKDRVADRREKPQAPALPPTETIEYIRQFARAYKAPLEQSTFPGIVLN